MKGKTLDTKVVGQESVDQDTNNKSPEDEENDEKFLIAKDSSICSKIFKSVSLIMLITLTLCLITVAILKMTDSFSSVRTESYCLQNVTNPKGNSSEKIYKENSSEKSYKGVWTESYCLRDVTSYKGNNKEAYAFFFCSRNDDNPDNYFEMMLVDIYKVNKLQKVPRDIIIVACTLVSFAKIETLKRLGTIVVLVEHLEIPHRLFQPNSIDSATRIHAWKLIGWDRILLLDTDVYMADTFEQIWDEPAAQIITTPPSRVSLNDTYLGVKVADLYPYAAGAVIDMSNLRRWTAEDKFNSGVFMIKPSLAHFKIIMETAYKASLKFEELEQSLFNYVYHSSRSLPWKKLDHGYNFYPIVNPYMPDYKYIHWKFWNNNNKGAELAVANWKDYVKESKMHTIFHYPPNEPAPLIQDRLLMTSTNHMIAVIVGLQIYNPKITFGDISLYALATCDIMDTPNAYRIREASNSNSSFKYTQGDNIFQINNLTADTTYLIYYFAESKSGSRQSEIYHTQYTTQK
jgi:hypothetical protein